MRPADVKDKLFQVIVGDPTGGWRDISGEYDGLTFTDVRPGGPGAASFTIYQDPWGVGYNELRPGKQVRIYYAGFRRWRGVILPRPVSYKAGSGSGMVPVAIQAAGIVEQARRDEGYGRVFVDRDSDRWADAEWDGMSPGLHVIRTGPTLKVAAANSSTFLSGSFIEVWYWMNDGKVDQDVVTVTFTWSSIGSMHWQLLGCAGAPSVLASWSSLKTGGGTTTVATKVSQAVAAGKNALALKVYYDADTTLTGDEYVKFAKLSVIGQSGTITLGTALQSILVTPGLADSFYSATVV